MPSQPTEIFEAPSFVVELTGADGDRLDIRSTFDVSRLPGATLASSGAWETTGTRVITGCVTGPSDRFIDGIEDVLFEKATWLAVRTLEREAETLSVVEPRSTAVENVRERVLEGTTTSKRPLRVQHLLAFHGKDRDLLLCSVACEGECDRVALVLEGVAETPPTPSWIMRAGFGAAANPTSTIGVVGAFALVVAGVLVWRRPARP